MPTIKPEKLFEALLDSIINHDLNQVKDLIQQGADVNGYEDRAKLRPLHYAVQYNFPEAVQILLAAGADPHATTSDEETPLDIARLYKNRDLIVLLEKIGTE